MYGIGQEGDANWRSSDVGASVGVFEGPFDMPYYEAATTTNAGRFPCQ